MFELFRIKKVYIFEFVKDGVQVGQGRIRVMFYVSPYKAHEFAVEMAKDRAGVYIHNFQRVQ